MALTNRAALSGVIPTPLASEILAEARRGSATLRLAEMKPITGGKMKWARVGEKPIAYFVGEGEQGTTSKFSISAQEADAKKLMVIVPVTRESFEDTHIDFIAEAKPEIIEAVVRKLDGAALHGTATVPGMVSVRAAAMSLDQYRVLGTEQDLASDLRSLIQAPTPKANRLALDDDLEFDLADLRDADRRPLVQSLTGDTIVNRLYGRDLSYFAAEDVASFEADLDEDTVNETYRARGFALAKKALFAGIARDIEYRVLTEASIDTDEGVLHLAQQDMVALQVTFRVATAVAADERVAVALETVEPAA